MGKYNSDWFSFEIKSKRHVMDLAISPSFAKGVGFQVHEMKNNSFQLFWNYELRPKEYGVLIKKNISKLIKAKLTLRRRLQIFSLEKNSRRL
ncbi:MAG: hypothetical protein IJQ85_10685 [Selenomonadaceae bacterium]|nr:hypothetical protein [Selenomonadaceae bacterium]